VQNPSLQPWKEGVIEKACTFMYSFKDHLKKGFLAVDYTNSGFVSGEEFVCVLSSVLQMLSRDKQALSGTQIEELSEIFKNDQKMIQWQQLLNHFVID